MVTREPMIIKPNSCGEQELLYTGIHVLKNYI